MPAMQPEPREPAADAPVDVLAADARAGSPEAADPQPRPRTWRRIVAVTLWLLAAIYVANAVVLAIYESLRLGIYSAVLSILLAWLAGRVADGPDGPDQTSRP